MTRAKAERTRSMLLGNRDSHPAIEKWNWILGRVYEDFDNQRLYEVTYIYYDNREQRVFGYSHSMDDVPADPSQYSAKALNVDILLRPNILLLKVSMARLRKRNLSSFNYEIQF